MANLGDLSWRDLVPVIQKLDEGGFDSIVAGAVQRYPELARRIVAAANEWLEEQPTVRVSSNRDNDLLRGRYHHVESQWWAWRRQSVIQIDNKSKPLDDVRHGKSYWPAEKHIAYVLVPYGFSETNTLMDLLQLLGINRGGLPAVAQLSETKPGFRIETLDLEYCPTDADRVLRPKIGQWAHAGVLAALWLFPRWRDRLRESEKMTRFWLFGYEDHSPTAAAVPHIPYLYIGAGEIGVVFENRDHFGVSRNHEDYAPRILA